MPLYSSVTNVSSFTRRNGTFGAGGGGAPSDVLFDGLFASDADGFSAGSRVAAEGADFSAGYLSVPASTTAVKTITAQATGKVRVDIGFRDNSTTNGVGATFNHEIMFQPTAGTETDATNACAVLRFIRDTGAGGSSTAMPVGYRNSAGNQAWLVTQFTVRGSWRALTVIIDLDANTYDIWLQGHLRLRNVSFPNASAADFSKIVVVGGSAASALHLDHVRVETNWSETKRDTVSVIDDFTLDAGAIETTTPDTDGREQYPQKWISPPNTTLGKFTRGANGLAPDATKQTLAVIRCGSEGVWEARWKASATAGNGYGGLLFNAYEGTGSALGTEDAYWLFRYAGASANDVVLFQGSTTIASTASPTGLTISAGDEYGLRVVKRGSFIWCYMNNFTTASGWVLQLSGPHDDVSAGGARGLGGEEWAGPLHAVFGGISDNYCKSFSYTGPGPARDESITVGDITMSVNEGGMRDLYLSGFAEPQTNLLVGKGIQLGHPPETEQSADRATFQQTYISATNVKSFRQRGQFYKSAIVTGVANPGNGDLRMTLLRRGVVADDRAVMTSAVQYGPDFDLRADLFRASGAKFVGPSGSIVDVTLSTFHDWTNRLSSVALPLAAQYLADIGSGNKARITMVVQNNTGLTGAVHNAPTKHKGNPDAISTVVSRPGANIVAGSTYAFGMHYFFETGSGLALNDTDLTNFRDDVATPATITFGTGSMKTDAEGDGNNDGYNGNYGWHEINCSGGVASFTLVRGTPAKRHGAAFRLHLHTLGANPTVTIAGGAAVAGTDYVWDNLGDGTGVLQLLSNRTADTAITIA